MSCYIIRESKKKHVQLIKDRKMFEAKITDMEKDCEEMMVSKFGCVIDLEKLETVTVNRTIEELKEKLRLTEIQCSEEIVEWNVSATPIVIKVSSLDHVNPINFYEYYIFIYIKLILTNIMKFIKSS